MNWMSDPRVVQAEADTLAAIKADKAGDPVSRRKLYMAAAEGFGAVAAEVPEAEEQVRFDLARAAIACYSAACNPVAMLGVIRDWVARGRALGRFDRPRGEGQV
jgi:hypothetical protein